MAADSLETSVTMMLADSSALDTAADVADEILDAIVKDGPLNEVPVFRYFLAAWRAPAQVRDVIFAKKLAKFFKPLREIPEAERQEFVRKLGADAKFQQKVGQHLLVIVDRLDDLAKPELVAGVFRAYIAGTISWQEFQELSVVVDRCVVSDLALVTTADRPTRFPSAAASRLSGCGVIEIAMIPVVRAPDVRNEYLLTDLGQLVVRVGLNHAARRVGADA